MIATYLEEDSKLGTVSGYIHLRYQEANLPNCIDPGEDHLWLLKYCQMSPIESSLSAQCKGNEVGVKDMWYILIA